MLDEVTSESRCPRRPRLARGGRMGPELERIMLLLRLPARKVRSFALCNDLERRAGARLARMQRPTAPSATAAVLAACAAGIIGSSQIFGILDNTCDELADYLGVDEVPAIAVSAVRCPAWAWEPLKALSLRAPRRVPRVQRRQRLNDCRCYHAASSGGRQRRRAHHKR